MLSVLQPISEEVINNSNESTAKDASLVDFILVYDLRDEKCVDFRRTFEKAVLEEDLVLDYETFRGVVFVKVTASFHRLAKEAERVRLEMSLRGTEIINPIKTWISWARNLFMTDDEVDFVSAPFQCDKLFLYEGCEDPDTFFRSSVRGFLVHHILINIDISKRLSANNGVPRRVKSMDESVYVQRAKEDVVNRIGLPYLLMNGTYTDAFVIHDPSASDPHYKHAKQNRFTAPHPTHDPRLELDHTWTKFFKFQPLWKIRNYYGEKIAFYFAWQGTLITLLWIPAILGLTVFIYGIYITVKHYSRKICNISFNQTDFSTVQSCTWVQSAKYVSEDVMDIVKRSFDNTYTPFFSLIICLWGALFLEIWKRNHATLSYQWDVDNFRDLEPDRPEFVGTLRQLDPITKQFVWIYPFSKQLQKYLISTLVVTFAICIVFISVTAVILFKVSMKITFNCTTSEDGDVDISQVSKGVPTCLITTTVLPSIFNSVSIIIFGHLYSKVAEKLTEWENHRTQTDHNNSLIIKLFAFQFVNTYSSLFYIAFFRPTGHNLQKGGIFHLGEQYTDTCAPGSCMPLLSFQIFILMLFKPFPKFFFDIALPFLKRQFYKIKSHAQGYSVSMMQAVVAAGVVLPDQYIQREYHKPNTGDFTLAEYTEKMIQFGYIMMFAASFPLAPFLALIMNLFDLRVDAKRLLWFNRRPVAFMAGDIGMWFPIMRFVTLCGVISNAFIIAYTSSFTEDFFPQFFSGSSWAEQQEIRLLVVVVFEHCVLVCMYVISVIIPDIPEGIKLAQRRERYEVTKLLEEASAVGKNINLNEFPAKEILSGVVESVRPANQGLKRKNAMAEDFSSTIPQKGDTTQLEAMPNVKRRTAMTVAFAKPNAAKAQSVINVGTDIDSEVIRLSAQTPNFETIARNDAKSTSHQTPSPTANKTLNGSEDNFSIMPNSIGSPYE